MEERLRKPEIVLVSKNNCSGGSGYLIKLSNSMEGIIRERLLTETATGTTIKVICPACRDADGKKLRETNHKIIFSHEKHWDLYFKEYNSIDFDGVNSYQVIECLGCGTTSFRHESYFSEDRYHDEHTGESFDGITENLFPLRSSEFITPKNFQNLRPTLKNLYREIIDCYNVKSSILCAAGLRALVEGICSDQKIEKGPVDVPQKGGGTKSVLKNTIEGKIAALHTRGILTKKNADILNEHRFLGNNAIHELQRPSNEDLLLAIEVIEHTLEDLYELPMKGVRLSSRRKTNAE